MIIHQGLANRSFTVWPFIFIGRNDQGSKEREDIALVHENVHYGRQRWVSPCWVLRWILDKDFRLREETLAYRAQMDVEHYDVSYYATVLSTQYEMSWVRGSISYEEALKALKEDQ